MEKDTKLLVENELKSGLIEDLDYIRVEHAKSVPSDRFAKGVRFAMLKTQGASNAEAYSRAFNEPDYDKARRESAVLVRSKWVNKVIEHFIAGNHILFSDKHYKVLNRMYEIAMDDDASTRNQIEAGKTFLEYTKMPVKEDVQQEVNVNVAGDIVFNLGEKISQLAKKGMIVNEKGELEHVTSRD